MKTSVRSVTTVIVTLSIVLLCVEVRAASPTPSGGKSDAELRKQIAKLQAKVKQLEAAASAHRPATGSPSMANMASPSSGDSMSMDMGEMKMGSMASPSPGMSAMPNQSMSGGMMMDMMNMMGHMNMPMPSGSPAMSGMSGMPQSALPGFPGVSHLYHIGSTGFFLDHAEHINLAPDQQSVLNKMKEQALAAKTRSDQQIEQSERELGELTSADQPDAAKIEKKVREIEKLRGDERLTFITAVGEAAKLLTDDQRKILVGAMQSNSPTASPSMSHM